MLGVLLSIVLFAISIPFKTLELAYKLKEKQEEAKNGTKQSLHDRISISNRKAKQKEKEKSGNVVERAAAKSKKHQKAMKAMMRAARLAAHAVGLFLKVLALVVQIIGFFISIIMTFWFVFLIAAVAAAVVVIIPKMQEEAQEEETELVDDEYTKHRDYGDTSEGYYGFSYTAGNDGIVRKKISILGDSVSAYEGRTPEGTDAAYPRQDVDSMGEMWWNLVASRCGYQIGEVVAMDEAHATDREPYIKDYVEQLPSNSDIVIIFVGLQDYLEGVDATGFNSMESKYDEIVKKVKKQCPNAEIYCVGMYEIEPDGTASNRDLYSEYDTVIEDDAIDAEATYIKLHNVETVFGGIEDEIHFSDWRYEHEDDEDYDEELEDKLQEYFSGGWADKATGTDADGNPKLQISDIDSVIGGDKMLPTERGMQIIAAIICEELGHPIDSADSNVNDPFSNNNPSGGSVPIGQGGTAVEMAIQILNASYNYAEAQNWTVNCSNCGRHGIGLVYQAPANGKHGGSYDLSASVVASGFMRVPLTFADGRTYNMRIDCSGYLSAVVSALGDRNVELSSGTFADQSKLPSGWTVISASNIQSKEDLQPGDILVMSGHVEMLYSIISDTQCKSWGMGHCLTIDEVFGSKTPSFSVSSGSIKWDGRTVTHIVRYTGR